MQNASSHVAANGITTKHELIYNTKTTDFRYTILTQNDARINLFRYCRIGMEFVN